LPTCWHDRNQYGNIVKNIIKTQYKSFSKTKDSKQKLKLSQNVAYLIQIENSLINDRHKSITNDLDFFAHLEIVTPEELRKDIDELFAKFRTDKEEPRIEKKYKENKKKEIIRNYIRDRIEKKPNTKAEKQRAYREAWSKNEGVTNEQ